MITAAIAFASALGISAVLTPQVRHFAKRHAMDVALSSRKVHVAPIPRLGGLAIVAGFFVPVVALMFLNSSMARELATDSRTAVALAVGGLAIAAIGAYDDIRGSDAKLKFLVQFGVAGFAYALGLRVEHIANPFGPPISLGILGMPFTVLFVVGIINAINLIDGLDGLAGGVALVAVLTSFVAAALHGEMLMMVITAALAGSILGFLFYNFNPASIFMGDTGSLFLGYILAVSAIKSHEKTSVVAIIVPLIALALPVADTLLAILRRAARGLPLFRGDREHIHHKLLAMGFSHRGVVLVLYSVAITLGLAATALTFLHGIAAAALVTALALVGGFFLRRLGYMPVEKASEVLSRRRRNILLQRAMSRVHGELRIAKDIEELRLALDRALSIIRASWARVEIVLGPDSQREAVYVGRANDKDAEAVMTRHGLKDEKLDGGFLELGWPDPAVKPSRDTELAVEALCNELYKASMRVFEHREVMDRATTRAKAERAKKPIESRSAHRSQRRAPLIVAQSEPRLDVETTGE